MRARLFAALLAAALLAPASAAAAIVEDGRVVTSFDGTPIVYTLMLPGHASGQPVPAVMATHGWGGTRRREPGGFASTLLDAGYAVLSWDSRGFGESGGEVEVDDPDHEARDAQALIDVLAADPRIAKDAPGDPRVGMSGGSYAGGIQFITAARDRRVDAIAPEIAWNDLLESLYPGGVVKSGWGTLLYGGGQTALTNGLSPENPAGPQLGAYSPELHRAYLEGLATGTFSPATIDFFERKGPDHLLARIAAPTFVIQATTDTLFTPNQAVDNFRTLARETAVPLKMAWYCGGHGTCAPFSSGPAGHVERRIVAWFDRYVRDADATATGPRFEYLTDDGAWHGAADFPVPGTTERTGRGGGVVTTNGEPVLSGILAGTTAHTSIQIPIPSGPGTLIGQPRVRLTATGVGAATDGVGKVALFFQLVNTTTGEVLGHQVTPHVLAADGVPHEDKLTLEAVAYTLGEGDRLALEVAGTAAGYEPYRGQGVVRLDDVKVSVPALP